MKLNQSLILVYFILPLYVFTQNPLFELTLKPVWQNLDNDPLSIKQFGGKWILAGIFDLKKRSPDPLRLNKLVLHWHGKSLNNILASLYRKEVDKKFLPIQEHLLCDSTWDAKTQKLSLHFDKHIILETRTLLYLVLTIPPHLEPLMQHGHFELESKALPKLLQNSLPKKPFILSFNK